MSGAGLHGILSAASPIQRKQVIQKLLVGDLADLADEGLYRLLPKLSPQPGKDKKLKKTKKQGHWSQNSERAMVKEQGAKQYWLLLFRWEETHQHHGIWEHLIRIKRYALYPWRRTLCTNSRDTMQRVWWLKLWERLFPELNLRSYMHCRSDIDLQTIRKLIQGRSRDESRRARTITGWSHAKEDEEANQPT